jgi:hypothetical protein
MQMSYKDATSGKLWIADPVDEENEYLCVSKREGNYYIFNAMNGKPFIKAKFGTKELALEMGKLLHKWYGEYFWIWEDPDWAKRDLIQLTQYTIPHGEEINAIIKGWKADEVIINLNIFSRFI